MFASHQTREDRPSTYSARKAGDRRSSAVWAPGIFLSIRPYHASPCSSGANFTESGLDEPSGRTAYSTLATLRSNVKRRADASSGAGPDADIDRVVAQSVMRSPMPEYDRITTSYARVELVETAKVAGAGPAEAHSDADMGALLTCSAGVLARHGPALAGCEVAIRRSNGLDRSLVVERIHIQG